ncbi:MAG: DNA-binding response regulator [Nitrospirae bacterium CG_4_10_14_0_8_um_filter_41_23]|nr:response regulator [Nitrospirota bacterium]PIQ93067.1 MAG: DNA-binding response regulator [Nitrospirae bacterium CG11_big_fil_rev_8_21_14_0_20_41_14]PIV43992.1 MAG: DNA-binding response regulator [Nitrospirae bacterium CG02_land_8_20_14_3_00_41_53]PIY86767.1 MAG: DNA-binding response regulator [Nitrospirae bacterium CG_4_10_14_0_8_um_filter_41_23]PJA80782.1 MAG: DNA-binding response regulator [Nitrospirae bacterium CG_4_9_14_3_um_filter_41_27]
MLVVDDEADLVKLVSYNLKKEGFIVDSASDGENALTKIRKGKYDLLILDLMLPGIQGIELCRILRNDPKQSSLPIIMLTARGEEVDRILGLEMGADDYMTKPFSPRELIARVKAVLRRATEKPVHEKILKTGDIEIDRERYTVSIKGRPVKLSATEFKLLLFLAERRGKVFSRGQLLDAIWRDEAFVEPRTVDVHIRRLRANIEEDPAHPGYIKTMRGIGYLFNEKP